MTPVKHTPTSTLEQSLIGVVTHAREAEAATAEAARIARLERIEAERVLKLARGTGDLTARAAAAVATSDLATLIENALRGEGAPMSIQQLAAATGAPAGRVLAELKRLRALRCPTRSREDAPEARQVYNVGTPDDPRWIWVVGDEGSSDELGAIVRKLLTLRPMSFAELTAATGARRGRLSGRIVQLQREGERLENVGDDPRVYQWKLVPRRKR